MSGAELVSALNDTISDGYEEIAEFRRAGVDAAKKRAAWKMALAKEINRLRAVGTPATLAETLAKGDPDVAQKEMEYNIADIECRTAQETVMMRKKEADVIREQIAREWSGGMV